MMTSIIPLYLHAQSVSIKRASFLPTEWHLFMGCFEKYPLLLRGDIFKTYLQTLNENLSQIDDAHLSYITKGMIYRLLLEIPPETTSSQKLSANQQLAIFDRSINQKIAPCPFYDWALRSLRQDLSMAMSKSNSKVKLEQASLNDVYEDKELAKDLKKIHYSLPWARYINSLNPQTKSTIYESEAWEGYLLSLLKMLAGQSSIYKQYSSPSLAPAITFELNATPELPTKEVTTPKEELDQLIKQQLVPTPSATITQ